MKCDLRLLLALACSTAFVLAYNNKQTSQQPEYLLEEDAHLCRRQCVLNDPPKICQYTFKIENYYTMSKACHECPNNRTDCLRTDCIPGDGHSRAVVSVNRRVPGPAIEVCKNDLVVVDVENELMSESTSIHFHGQHMKDTPYMDGVPYVTQCPILPKTTFRYQFHALQAGTHFWHSHFGMQRVDGCYGPLIVRVPDDENPHDPLYDYDLSEHTLSLIDWEVVSGMEKFLFHHHSVGDNKPRTLLVNGRGRNKVFNDDGSNDTLYTPLERFFVEQGYRYRFRVINAGFLNCPIELSVDNHTITVISSDGKDLLPTETDSLVIYAGERFDFVVAADQPKSLYWMRFRGLMDCDERYQKAFQVAVLEYSDYYTYVSTEDAAPNNDSIKTKVKNLFYSDMFLSSVEGEEFPDSVPDYDNSQRVGKQINSLNKGMESNSSHVTIPELSSVEKWDHTLKLKPDYQLFLAYDFYKIDNPHFHGLGYEFNNVAPDTNQLLTPQINHISMQMPSFPLLPQRDEIPSDMFCNNETMKSSNCSTDYCECPHGYQIPTGSIVELVIIDEGFAYDANHPFHLHGYSFRVVAMEKVGNNVTVEQVKSMDAAGAITRNLLDAPLKDTVTIPDGGYTIVRFEATNPGYWLFHCHLEFHAEIGMAVLFKVGENEEMKAVPKEFPRCGNYLPVINETETPSKPVCSKSSFIKKFEILLGEDCDDEGSGTDNLRGNVVMLVLVLLHWTLKSSFLF